ncbi:MAG TPA: hypothetical protein VLE23_07335 [Geminicoccaceae bacterium]|nr:hypothetical protein [Geminicoccaceae bacterium]
MESLVDWFFVLVTGAVAYHGLTYRNADGDRDLVRTLFGCIALLFCLRVLFVDILELI